MYMYSCITAIQHLSPKLWVKLDTSEEAMMNLLVMFSHGPQHTDMPVLVNRQELTNNNSSMQAQDAVWKTCQEWWTIGMDGEKVLWCWPKKDTGNTKGLIEKHIQGAYDKFLDFFRMGTFIDSTHMKL